MLLCWRMENHSKVWNSWTWSPIIEHILKNTHFSEKQNLLRQNCAAHSVRKHVNRMDATLWWTPYWCPRMLLTQSKCFGKIWTNRGTYPKLGYSSTDYVLWLLQRINGVYGFMWTHVVSMGESEGERERWRYWDQNQNSFIYKYLRNLFKPCQAFDILQDIWCFSC